MSKTVISVLDFGAQPGSSELQTTAFQAALDKAFAMGGAVVEVPAGKYIIGGLRLRSHTTLHLLSGAELYGVRDPEQYCILKDDALEPIPEEWKSDKLWEPFRKDVVRCTDFLSKPAGRWHNAIIRALNAEDIAIIGEPGSVIDGQDCFDEQGEEYYRGPHGIDMHFCRSVTFRGYTIRHTGNWAHNIFDTTDVLMENVTVLGGHDGFHIRGCANVTVRDSGFYTGDDGIAGFANVNTLVSNCICNSACSALRFGATNALIRDCKFIGPAKYPFRGSLNKDEKRTGVLEDRPHRHNMLSMFTYLADFTKPITEQPGNIVITNCTAENADRFLHYNFSGNERWQCGRPLESLKLENIQATGIAMPLTAYGSPDVPVTLTMKNLDISFREDLEENTAFMHAANYERIRMENVTINKKPDAPLIKSWTTSGQIDLRNVTCEIPEEERICYTDEPFVCKSI